MSTTEKMLESSADVKANSKPRMTPLMSATMNFTSIDYDFDAVCALIKAGADVNA